MTESIQQTQSLAAQKTLTRQEEPHIFEALLDGGLIEDIPKEGNLPLPDFAPLPAKGKPTSEMIIEDRGER